MAKMNQTEQRALRKNVYAVVKEALEEKGYFLGVVEKGLAIGVLKDGSPAPDDFSEETFFFEIGAVFKKDYDFEDEVAEYEKKLAKSESKDSGEKKRVSVADLDLKNMTQEELEAMEALIVAQKIADREKQNK